MRQAELLFEILEHNFLWVWKPVHHQNLFYYWKKLPVNYSSRILNSK